LAIGVVSSYRVERIHADSYRAAAF